MVQINWTIQAKNDLKSIFQFISKDSKTYAKRQILSIKERTSILIKFMYPGRIVPEIGLEEIREIIARRYRIIYRIVSENQIDIITIHHSSRDLERRIEEIK